MLSAVIRNANYNVCKMCKNLRLDPMYPKEYRAAKCMKFGHKCVVSGEVSYLLAERCRRDSSLCGEEGLHFEPSKTDSNF
jgi:hypothetical protein